MALKIVRKLLVMTGMVFVVAIVFLGMDAYRFKKESRAVAILPYFFGGTVTMNTPCQVSDNYGNCLNCTSCGPITGNFACEAYDEIRYAPSGGMGTFVCPPKAFLYVGSRPMPGMPILGGGAGPAFPYVIGSSGFAYNFADNFFLAGFRE